MAEEPKSQDPANPEQIRDSNKQSVAKIRSFLDGLKNVEEHEKTILDQRGPRTSPKGD